MVNTPKDNTKKDAETKGLPIDPQQGELITGEGQHPEIPMEGDPSLLQCQKDRDEYLNIAKRLKADFENYKKDEEKKFRAAVEYSNYGFVVMIMAILDDFDRAEKNAPEDIKKTDWFKGVDAIIQKLRKELEGEGLKAIEAIGKPFDPKFHEALGYTDVESGEDGVVTEEYKKGYLFQDKVARPATVMISKLKKKE